MLGTLFNPVVTDPVSVRPLSLDYWLILTALCPLSHHDPAQKGEGNTLLFNRAKHLLPLPQSETRPSRAVLQALYDAHPCSPDFAPLLNELPPPSFIAAALLKLFCDLYNRGEGGKTDGDGNRQKKTNTSAFTGIERYERLSHRTHVAATQAVGLRQFWDILLTILECPLSGADSDLTLFQFFTLPAGLQSLVLRFLVREHASLTAVARAWHAEGKQYSEAYVAKSGQDLLTERIKIDANEDAVPDDVCGMAPAEIYNLSGNSVRHQAVRAPAWLHLASMLGIHEAEPGLGQLFAGTEAHFVNGGNMMGKAPNDPHKLAIAARLNFPTIDLLGGCFDGFDAGPSRLSVAPWLVCRENMAALRDTPASGLENLRLSAFEMSDDVTHVRSETERGVGQMIMSFETLAAGVQFAVRLSLTPWTPARTQGALVSAVSTYEANHPHVGGQVARGFGAVAIERRGGGGWETAETAQEEYESYLLENREKLQGWLQEGTLGTGSKILS